MSNRIRCAIYTRKSTDEGLEQEFSSLDAQHDACAAYIASQRGLGWICLKARYDDGGLSGGNMDRPALQALLTDIGKGKIDLIVVYKVDRLTRSLADFAKIVDTLDNEGVSFASVTQQFNTSTSMGRMTLNVLMTFAQFEREVTAERIRDKIAASKKKGMWMGGSVPIGYNSVDKKLVINEEEAATVRCLFGLYIEKGNVREVVTEAKCRGFVTRRRMNRGRASGGNPFSSGHLYHLLRNPVYVGRVSHKGKVFPGQHDAIVDPATWDAVQCNLNGNASPRRFKHNNKHPGLLYGLLFDENGVLLTSTFTVKAGKKYRYYVSQDRSGDKNQTEKLSMSGWRLGALEIEGTVTELICDFLCDVSRIRNAIDLNPIPPDQITLHIRKMELLAKNLRQGTEVERRQIVSNLVQRIGLSPTMISISLYICKLMKQEASGIATLKPRYDEAVTIEIPMAMRRRGVEHKIVLRPSHSDPIMVDDTLVLLVAKARHWFEQIAKGEVASIRELAQANQVDEGDVSRFMPLAFLATDIVEDIVAGRQPTELTSERLKRIGKLPLNWSEQRKVLGFST